MSENRNLEVIVSEKDFIDFVYSVAPNDPWARAKMWQWFNARVLVARDDPDGIIRNKHGATSKQWMNYVLDEDRPAGRIIPFEEWRGEGPQGLAAVDEDAPDEEDTPNTGRTVKQQYHTVMNLPMSWTSELHNLVRHLQTHIENGDVYCTCDMAKMKKPIESEEEPETSKIKKEDLEQLLDVGTLSDWQWRWVDLIVNQGHGLERTGPYFVLTPKRK